MGVSSYMRAGVMVLVFRDALTSRFWAGYSYHYGSASFVFCDWSLSIDCMPCILVSH